MKWRLGSAYLVTLCLLAFQALPSAARADFVFQGTSISLGKSSGGAQHLAGAHPDLRFSFDLRPGSGESIHDLVLDLPPGLVASATAVPPCSPDEFFVPENAYFSQCPEESRVGRVELWRPHAVEAIEVPLFSLEHGADVPMRFGFLYGVVPVFLEPSFRAEDLGVSAKAGISQVETLAAAAITLWGVPGDPVHGGAPPAESAGAPVPLLRNPTSCQAGPAQFVVRGDSWEHRDAFDVVALTSEDDGAGFVFEGCGSVPFAPTLNATPSSSAADSPTGLDLDIRLPQSTSPSGQTTSDLRRAVIGLPDGLTISDSAAAGLGACAPAQVRLGSNDPPACPDSSRIGTARVRTPMLAEGLEGEVYLARQGDNPFGSDLALYFVVEGPGFYLKLPARVDADSGTGQLTIAFSNLPQLPFEELSLELKDGPRALLQTPRACGTYAIAGELVPWSGGEPVRARSSFRVSEGCGGGDFAPGLRAGTTDSSAGAASSFALQVTRRAGEQNLATVSVTLPRGLTVRTAGVPLCGDTQIADNGCPAASRIGRVTVGAGAGPAPLYLPEAGKEPTEVYLAGPYRGAPYSLVAELPARAGPFELGVVTVRFAVHVDPVGGRASVRSDALPQLLRGIPISYRDLRVELDRPGFIRNPTSCGAMRIRSAIRGSEGATAGPTAGFRATGCGRLAFDPAFSLRFSGPTHRSAHPGLRTLLRGRSGDANVGGATIVLPPTEYLDNAHIQDICSREEYAAGECPQASVYGWARARTPLLDEPLRGPVFLRSSGRGLPDLVAALDGPIELDLVGRIDSADSLLRIALRGLPDVPLSRFALTLRGGRGGLLVNNTELCRARPRARVDLVGQNGKRASSRLPVQIGCGGRSGR